MTRTASKGANADELLKLDNQLCFALYAGSRAMISAYRPVLEQLGLTYPQYLVMLVLWERDGLRVSELGGRLYLDSGTLTPVLKRMEAAGLLVRERRTGDEREVEIRLTAAGRALKQRARTVPEEILCRAARPAKELAALRDELKRLLIGLSTPTKGKER